MLNSFTTGSCLPHVNQDDWLVIRSLSFRSWHSPVLIFCIVIKVLILKWRHPPPFCALSLPHLKLPFIQPGQHSPYLPIAISSKKSLSVACFPAQILSWFWKLGYYHPPLGLPFLVHFKDNPLVENPLASAPPFLKVLNWHRFCYFLFSLNDMILILPSFYAEPFKNKMPLCRSCPLPDQWDRNSVWEKFFRRFWWASLVRSSPSANPGILSSSSTLDSPEEIF